MYYLEKYLRYSANILSWLAILGLLFFVAPKLTVMSIPFILGWLIALIANPLVRFLEARIKIRRKLGSILIILTVLTLLVLGTYFAIAKLVAEAISFIAQLPTMYSQISGDLKIIQGNLQNIVNTLPPAMQDSLLTFGDNVFQFLARVLENSGKPTITAAGNFAKNIPSILIAILITIISSYFMLADKEEISEFVIKSIPKKIRDNIHHYSQGVRDIIGGYFKAQFKIMGVVGVILFVGFILLKVPFALLFSVLIALLDFLPFFGTGTALGPWAIFNLLSGDYKMALGLIILYAVSQGVRHAIQPKILGDTIGMNPLLAMILMYYGYRLFGVMGLILSAPLGMLVINLDKQGFFDNVKFIVSDIWKDIRQLQNIERYKKS